MQPFLDAGNDLWGLDRRQALEVLVDAALASHGADAPFYSPDQLRDEQGRWTTGAGGRTAAEHAAGREEALGAVRGYLGGKLDFPSATEREHLAQHLSRLTVAQLHAVKAEFGLRGSAANKAALVAKLAERFRAYRERNFPESVSTGVDKGAGARDNTPVGQTTPTGAKTMQTQELPNLTGSEKQVEWADRIRAQAIPAGHPFEAEIRAAAAGKADARWWIDRAKDPGNSDVTNHLLAEALAPEAGKTGVKRFGANPAHYAAALQDTARRGLPADQKERRKAARSVVTEGRGNGVLPSVIAGHLARLGFARGEVVPVVEHAFRPELDGDDDDFRRANRAVIDSDLTAMRRA